ncbi:MAG TPA: hypothetical protein VJQ44_12410 [Gemmatimonadales bacterium]|nr:hypothetical protein [Gemmatimonadales bacterium]
MRRELGLLIALVVVVDLVCFGIYTLAGLGRAAPGVKLGFTVLWTAATLAVVLPRLLRIRALRRGR